MARKLRFSVWIPALLISLVLNVYLLLRPQEQIPGVKVIGVIDGDTIVLEGKSKVRLRYVDAPEKGLCGYEQANNALEHLVTGKAVRIEETIPDQYGRGMALVYSGKTLINKEMVASGWVRYHHDMTSVTDEIKAVSDTAKKQQLGIYGACVHEHPPDPSCVIKANIDDNSDRKNYYLPGCPQYAYTIVEEDMGEGWYCTEKDAVAAGFTKAKNCPK